MLVCLLWGVDVAAVFLSTDEGEGEAVAESPWCPDKAAVEFPWAAVRARGGQMLGWLENPGKWDCPSQNRN